MESTTANSKVMPSASHSSLVRDDRVEKELWRGLEVHILQSKHMVSKKKVWDNPYPKENNW